MDKLKPDAGSACIIPSEEKITHKWELERKKKEGFSVVPTDNWEKMRNTQRRVILIRRSKLSDALKMAWEVQSWKTADTIKK